MLSWNFSSKSPWCSLFPLKFESYYLKRCKKSCRKLVFWVFSEQLLHRLIFWRLHCYEGTLVKRYNKPLLLKSETRIFDQKIFQKILVQTQRKKKNSGILRLNQIMPKLFSVKLHMFAGKLVANSAVFRKKGAYSKSVTKTLYQNKFSVSECIFKLVCHCESCRWLEICCA